VVFATDVTHAAGGTRPAAAGAVTPDPVLVHDYCVPCHNARNKARVRDFVLEDVDIRHAADHPEIWEKVIKKMRGGLMPPAGSRRPEGAAYDGFVRALESSMDAAAASKPDPGRTETFHRLNRTEYQNVIRDLLALDINAEDLLPADDAGGGNANFDNIAASLRLNQSMLERYLSTAQKVSREALGGIPPPSASVFKVSSDLRQDGYLDGMPLGTRGGIRVEHEFPVDAEYEFRVALAGAGKDDLELSLDGQRAHVFTITARRLGGGYDDATGGGDALDVRLAVKAGPHVVIATFPKTQAAVEVVADRLPFVGGRGPLVGVDSVTIQGPFNVLGPGNTPSRERIFVCRPADPAQEEPCARKIFMTLARRGYRRPASTADIDRLMVFYRQGRADEDFDAGVGMALRALLVSPEFLVRIEHDPRDAAPNTTYRVTDLELASRLSFFLWSSIPDDELLDAAVRGRLKDPVMLEKQVRRMLADRRADVLTSNFAAQWLYLRNLKDATPIRAFFPNFDEALRQAFFKETELFFDSVRTEDRSILDLLDADYTFVNERLALHYDIPCVSGADFKRVSLPTESPRRGLLGKGSILLVTSPPQRTSPVLRGKWILENILGTPPPPPPPNVPPLPEQKQNDGRVLSVRELLTKHRANPVCAACHSMLDPIGFALEGFDAIGRWRTVDVTFKPVDASGAMPDGTKFSGVAEFRATLLAHPDRFATTVAEKLMTYALGRGITYGDAPAIRQIVRDASKNNYKFSAMVLGVIKSIPFQMRRTAAPAAAAN
jgi:hypothetical protein